MIRKEGMNTPEPIITAFNHVRQHHPEVIQVFFGVDGRWMYCGDGFEAPTFGAEIDVGILEEAYAAVPYLPYAYAPPQGFYHG